MGRHTTAHTSQGNRRQSHGAGPIQASAFTHTVVQRQICGERGNWGRQNEMEVDKAYPVKVQAETGLAEKPRGKPTSCSKQTQTFAEGPPQHRYTGSHQPILHSAAVHQPPITLSELVTGTCSSGLPKTEQALTTSIDRRGNGWTTTTGPTS